MQAPADMAEWLHIRAGLLVDGRGGLARGAEVLIHQGKIAAVGPSGSIPLPDAPICTIDAPNGTVVPGFVDAHLHVTYSGHVGMQQLEWPNSLEFAAVSAGANATHALACGYTSALDAGCRGRIGVATKRAIREGIVAGPDLRVSGQIISTTGGPLDLWPSSMRLDPATRLVALVSGPDEIRRTIREQAKDGVDNVKLQITGSVVQGKGSSGGSIFSSDELAAATDTAHQLGLSISAHAEGPVAIRQAIVAGFDTIQHASYVDAPTIDLLESHPACRLVFTLGVYDDIIQIGPSIGYSPDAVAVVSAAWESMVAAVRLAYDRGVPFAVGSDTGGKVHPHGRYSRDIVLLVRSCGIPVEHAIRAATRDAAAAAWIPNVGTLTAGADADVAVLAGDLSQRIELLDDEASVRVVIQKGRVVRGPVADAAAAISIA